MFYLFHSCCFSTRRFSFTWCGHFSLCVTWEIFIAASGTACAQRKLLLQYTNFCLSYLLPLPLPRLCCCSLCCARRAPPPTQRSWENNKKSTRRARRPYATILWKRMSVNSYRYFDVNGKCTEREGTRERANDKRLLLRTIIDNICVVPRNTALNLFTNEPLYDMKTINVNCT